MKGKPGKSRLNKSKLKEAKRNELLIMAKSFGIRGRHRMTREKLIRALELHLKKSPSPQTQDSPTQPIPVSSETPKKQGYYDLPWSYGETGLVLMPVDPFLVYAYWDFSPKEWEDIQNKKERVVLRIYDVTMIQFNGTNAHYSFDIPVKLEAQNWYFPLWSAEKSLCADLGWFHPDGLFHPISRSNVIQTPRAGVSVFEETRWLEVRQARRKPAHKDLLRRLQLRRITTRRDENRDKRPSFWDQLIADAGSITSEEAGGLSSRGGIWAMNRTRNRT